MATPIPWFNKFLDGLAGASISNMGNLLVFTSVCAWIASSAAQIFGIATNKNYSNAQKKFMISQEMADAGVNIGTYLLFTQPLVLLSSKLVSTGKLAPKEIVSFMRKTNTISRRGDWTFDVTMNDNFSSVKNTYDMFKGFTGSVAAVAGGIISSNVITPILRNKIASRRQNKYLVNKPSVEMPAANPATNPTKPAIKTPRHTFEEFRRGINPLFV